MIVKFLTFLFQQLNTERNLIDNITWYVGGEQNSRCNNFLSSSFSWTRKYHNVASVETEWIARNIFQFANGRSNFLYIQIKIWDITFKLSLNQFPSTLLTSVRTEWVVIKAFQVSMLRLAYELQSAASCTDVAVLQRHFSDDIVITI